MIAFVAKDSHSPLGDCVQSSKLTHLLRLMWESPIFGDAFPETVTTDAETIREQGTSIYTYLLKTLGPLLAQGLPLAAPATILEIIGAIAPKATAFCPALAAGETGDLERLQAAATTIALAYWVDQSIDGGDEAMLTAVRTFRPQPAPKVLIFPSPATAETRARLTILESIEREIIRLSRPEDQPWLMQAMFVDTLGNEATMRQWSQRYDGCKSPECFWAEHAEEVAACSIVNVGLVYVTAAIYAIYRQQEPELPGLAEVLSEPIILALLQGPCNAAIRVFDDLGDRLVDGGENPAWSEFALNIFNQPNPRVVEAFLVQAGLADEASLGLLLTAFQSQNEAGRTLIRKVFMGLVRYRMAALPQPLWERYGLFLTLAKRVIEAGYINMLGDMNLGEVQPVYADSMVAAD